MTGPVATSRRQPLSTGLAPAVVSILAAVLLGCTPEAAGDDSPIPDEASGIEAPALPDSAAGIASVDQAQESVGQGRELPWEPGVFEAPAEGAHPVGIWIPSIEVTAPMRGLGLEDNGELEVPTMWDLTGWYVGGPRPGERGPAVIAGHVDSRTGPAVFHDLGAMERGDLAHVVYEDGFVVSFVALESERVAKDAFPTARVYGNTDRPDLRLITCGGRFDQSVRSYEDNVIVYASVYATWHRDALDAAA